MTMIEEMEKGDKEVSLINILRDQWLDKKKFPIVSIIKWHDSSATYTDVHGEIWVGDYDIGCIMSDRVEITAYSDRRGRTKNMTLNAADPNFFTHLENTLLTMMRQLKDMSDGEEGSGADRSRPDYEGLS